MSNVIDINGILEAQRVRINATRVAKKLEASIRREDSEAKKLFGGLALEGWLEAGNGRKTDDDPEAA